MRGYEGDITVDDTLYLSDQRHEQDIYVLEVSDESLWSQDTGV